MATTTDFEDWVTQADPDGFEEVYALYRAVEDVEQMGMYECTENNGRYFVKSDCTEDTLMLASPKAYKAFLHYIDSRFGIDEDIESWYGFKRAMAKDD